MHPGPPTIPSQLPLIACPVSGHARPHPGPSAAPLITTRRPSFTCPLHAPPNPLDAPPNLPALPSHTLTEVEIKLRGEGPWVLTATGEVVPVAAAAAAGGAAGAGGGPGVQHQSDVEFVFTPGHTAGHVCMYYAPQQVGAYMCVCVCVCVCVLWGSDFFMPSFYSRGVENVRVSKGKVRVGR